MCCRRWRTWFIGVFAYFHRIPGYLAQRNVQIGIVSIAIATYAFLHPPVGWETSCDGLADHGSFALYWITLGVLSSVGLGTRISWIQTVWGMHNVGDAAVSGVCSDAAIRRQFEIREDRVLSAFLRSVSRLVTVLSIS